MTSWGLLYDIKTQHVGADFFHSAMPEQAGLTGRQFPLIFLANIRTFIKYGWQHIEFDNTALKRKEK